MDHLGLGLLDVAHLWRLTFWSLASLATGLLILLRHRKSGFGAMTAGWGLVNMLILIAILRQPPSVDPHAYRGLVRLNLGLNLVWLAIGAAMMRSRNNPWVAAAGLAMVQQAAVLEALDGFLYWQLGGLPVAQ